MSSAALEQAIGRPWKRPPLFKRNWLRVSLMIGFAVYLVAAFMTIEVNWARVYEGLDQRTTDTDPLPLTA